MKSKPLSPNDSKWNGLDQYEPWDNKIKFGFKKFLVCTPEKTYQKDKIIKKLGQSKKNLVNSNLLKNRKEVRFLYSKQSEVYSPL